MATESIYANNSTLCKNNPQCSSCDAADMDKTIEYYEKHFGLKKVRYRDIPEASLSTREAQYAGGLSQPLLASLNGIDQADPSLRCILTALELLRLEAEA